MSDPQTNVQIEDVLSSIRRLVSEEIGQMPARKPVKVVREADEEKLVLSPTQKIAEEESEAKDDLWEATQQMAPQEPAPVWWHRETATDPEKPAEPFVLDADTMSAPAASDQEDVLVSEAVAENLSEISETMEINDLEVPEPEAADSEEDATPETLEGALLGLRAARDLQDDNWEPPEGEADLEEGVQFGSMPWDDAETETTYEDEPIEVVGAPLDEASTVATDEIEDIPFRFRPGERLYERLSKSGMIAEPEPEPTFQHSDQPTSSEPIYEEMSLDAGETDGSNIFDEDMLREMVADIVRQELQGVLGERITRNVRKLVRREIQRALSDLNS